MPGVSDINREFIRTIEAKGGKPRIILKYGVEKRQQIYKLWFYILKFSRAVSTVWVDSVCGKICEQEL